MKGYDSSIKASQASTTPGIEGSTVEAGDYYIQDTMDDYLLISPNEDGSDISYWIDSKENDANAGKNTSTKNKDDDADPSNTDSLSGYYQQNQNSSQRNHRDKPVMVEHTCYIKNLVTGTTIMLDVPPQLSDSYSAQFDPVSIRGRSNQLQGYSETTSREISWTVEVHDDYAEYGLAGTIAMLKALVYPNYSGYVETPVCYIRIGNAVSGRFVMTSVSVDYQIPYRDDMFVYAEVQLSATEAGDVVYSAAEIEGGGGMS